MCEGQQHWLRVVTAVLRPIGLYDITSSLRFLRFFKIQKVVIFYVFCRVSYVFSNYGHALHATMLAASANTYSHATPTIFGIRSNISPKLLEIETWNLVHDSVMPSASGRTDNFP